MQAIRDDEGGARGLGVNVYRTRFVIWVIAALWTALAAAPYYLQQLRVQPVGTAVRSVWCCGRRRSSSSW